MPDKVPVHTVRTPEGRDIKGVLDFDEGGQYVGTAVGNRRLDPVGVYRGGATETRGPYRGGATETQLVSEAKGYDGGRLAEAQRQVDSYFENFRDRDTPANRGIVLQMSDPAIQADMQQLFDQADGKVMNMDTATALPDAARGTSRDAGQAATGSAVPVTTPNPLYASGRDPYTGAPQGSSPYAEEMKGREARVSAAAAKEAPSQTPVSPPAAGQVPVLDEPPPGPGYIVESGGVIPLRHQQSTNQGVVEPEEAKQLRGQAFADENQAIEDEAFYTKFRDTQLLAQQNDRISKLNQLAKEDAQFQDRQNRIAAETEGRIKAAEQALKDAEIDPNFNPMREIFEGDDWGKKILFGIGNLFGSIGASAQTNATGIYHANQFMEQFEKSVNRKLDLLNKRYNARKDQLVAAQDGYARMRQILQDQAATRAMIEARAWQMFDAEVDKVMQQYNIDMADPRAQMLKATTARKQREAAMEGARTTNHTVGMQEQQRQITIVPTGGGDTTGEDIVAFDKAKHERGLTEQESLLDLIDDGISKTPAANTWKQEWANYIYSGRPGRTSQLFAQWIADDPDALASVAAAMNTHRHALFGGALTAQEIEQGLKEIGTGNKKTLTHFFNIIQSKHRTGMAGLRAAFPKASRIHEQRRRENLQLPDYEPTPVRTDKP